MKMVSELSIRLEELKNITLSKEMEDILDYLLEQVLKETPLSNMYYKLYRTGEGSSRKLDDTTAASIIRCIYAEDFKGHLDKTLAELSDIELLDMTNSMALIYNKYSMAKCIRNKKPITKNVISNYDAATYYLKYILRDSANEILDEVLNFMEFEINKTLKLINKILRKNKYYEELLDKSSKTL